MSSYGGNERCAECGQRFASDTHAGVCGRCNRRKVQSSKPESAVAWKDNRNYEGRMMVARVMAVCIDKVL